jgi:methanogenic corrinoid protein MtbC1
VQPSAERLVRAIEGQIIPRLLRVHRIYRTGYGPPSPAPVPRPGAGDIATLAGLVLGDTVAPAMDFIGELLEQGMPLDAAYLDLMAPAARHLGALWDDDQLDCLQVTLGLCRLQQVVSELAPAFVVDQHWQPPAQRVLLCPVPGEHHTFGLRIVSDFFRRAGWQVVDRPAVSRDALLASVRAEPFDIVGLSVSCDTRIEQTASIIAAMRRQSRNRHMTVMVGGPAFAGRPGLVSQVGADATALDGREAAAHARQLVTPRATPTC